MDNTEGQVPVDNAGVVGVCPPPPSSRPSSRLSSSSRESVLTEDSIWEAAAYAPLTPQGMAAWAHYDQNSRRMNHLPPYF